MVEVGDFIRTKSQIAKIIGYDDDNNFLLDIQQIITKTEAKNLKHSKNIIDLIEVGDFVNGERILDITGEYIHTNETDHNKFYLSTHIKTILTHEQYKQNAYEVEE